LLDHQHGGIALDRLVDRGHDAEIHQHGDDLGRLDRHSLRQFGHRDGLAERDLPPDRRGGHLEAMLGLRAGRHGARAQLFLLLMPRADVTGNVQLLTPVARALLVIVVLARHGWRMSLLRLAARLGAAALALALGGFFGRALLGRAARILLRLLLGLLFLDAPAVLRLDALALAPLGFGLLGLGALGLLGLAPLYIDLFLLRARLAFEHVALDIGALAAHFHVDGAGAALIAGELELLLGLALERDAARSGARLMAMAAAQVRQQLELGLLADAILRPGDTDARLVELGDQPVDRHFQHIGKLGNRYFSHSFSPWHGCAR